MPRRPRFRSSVLPYHVVDRCNNRDAFPLPLEVVWKIFCREAYAISALYGAQIHALVVMLNHYHMILTSPLLDLGDVMNHFNRSISQTINSKSGREGHLFGGRYKASLIDTEQYFADALKYVYRNPVKAGVCSVVEDYPFSTLHGLLGGDSLHFPIHHPYGNGPFYMLGSEEIYDSLDWLEVISKPPQQDDNRGELNESEIDLGVPVAASLYSSKGLKPGEESFDHPSSSVAS